MPIATTAKQHFDEDMVRSRDLLNHTTAMQPGRVRDDIMRASWMLGVGAADAFFCDAYSDLIARTLQARQRQPDIALPDRIRSLRIPVAAFIRLTNNENWRWRMAARELIEKESVLDLAKIKSLFNPFFDRDRKLFGERSFDAWLFHRDGPHRLFGVRKPEYRRLQGRQLEDARNTARRKFEKRFYCIFQRRHDCIHNCDRVRMAINTRYIQNNDHVEKVLCDIEFLVSRCFEAFGEGYPEFLQGLGFDAVTRNRILQ